MKTLVIILCLLCAGCATTTPITKEVLIPVSKSCYEGKTKPVYPGLYSDIMTGEEDISNDNLVNNLLTDINKLKLYSEDLEVLIC